MLDELHIRNVALIEEATFAPGPGMTCITGETGAGKTALLSALKLLVGERADVGYVRDGADALEVDGRFYLPGSPEEGTVVSRRFSQTGRSRISLDGSPANAKTVAATVGSSVDLCGQHEHQRLTKPAHQLALLDAWAGERIAVPLAAYRDALSYAGRCADELARLETLGEADQREVGQAQFLVEKVDEVTPEPGEYERLLEEMPRFEHAEALLRDVETARVCLTDDQGALLALEQAMSAVDRIGDLDTACAPLAERMRDVFFGAEEVASELAAYRDTVEFDPEECQCRQDRIASFQSLLRGFGPTMDDVFAAYDAALRRLDEDRNRDELIDRARRQLASAEEALADTADNLTQARRQAAPLFTAQIDAQMERLNMGSATVTGSFEMLPRVSWTAAGPHTFQLLFAPGAALTPQPLAKIASGGELSRVMLACKVVIGEKDSASTLVFDEVDAGVGGSTALALAAVLADLAQTHQVIVVTHLAQVAVKGAVHYVVRKSEGDVPRTSLCQVEGADRISEIARMLDGVVDQASLVHAQEMLTRELA